MFIENMYLDMQKISSLNHPRNNTHGTQLLQIMTKNTRFLGPDFHTTYGAAPNGTAKGRPDLILANRLSLPFHHHASPGPLSGSDHIPVILHLSPNPIAIPSPPRQDYNRTDWENFQATLNDLRLQQNFEGLTPQTLDAQAERIQKSILDAANTHSPTVHYNIFIDFKPSLRTQRLITCYRHRLLHNQLHVHRVLWDLNILRRHILASLQEDHNRHWHHLIQRTEIHRTTTPSKFWARIRRLQGTDKQHFEYLLINNIKIHEPREVAEAFKQHWENVFQPHPPTQHPLRSTTRSRHRTTHATGIHTHTTRTIHTTRKPLPRRSPARPISSTGSEVAAAPLTTTRARPLRPNSPRPKTPTRQRHTGNHRTL